MVTLRQEIVKQYVASLKEDSELDYIFPLLLERMGFRILSTPKQSKGQSQYGRDVVAVKKDKGVPTLYLIELKGFRAHDVNDRTLNEKDGLIESMRASKNTPYRDSSIPGLDTFARKYVYVHNGTVDANSVPTLDGFVANEFPNGEFERWDLGDLTQMFSRYLFEETLLTDDESYRLFKRSLVLLDSEGNDYSDIVKLVDLQIARMEGARKPTERAELNFFATLRLIGAMVHYYSEQADNLYPAKYCMDTIVLKTWGWILRNKFERKKRIIKLFHPLVVQQFDVYEAYLNKIIAATGIKNGFYGFDSRGPEQILYPLRCYDFLNDILYFFYATGVYGASKDIVDQRKTILKEIIRNNSGFKMPLLDTHSIPIQLLFLYFQSNPTKDDSSFMAGYLVESVINMIRRHNDTKLWPEMLGNRMALAKSMYEKSDDYGTSSSLLITTFLELLSYMGLEDTYASLKKQADDSDVSLQIAYPIQDEFDIETALFSGRLYDELSVQTNLELPDSAAEFREKFRKPYNSISYRTDKAGYSYLRILAHIYYQTDLFPDVLGRAFCAEI